MHDEVGRSGLPNRVIALWSAPRCRSTAFLRMFMERGDFTVIHEPFSHVADFGEASVGGRTVRSERELIDAIRELASSTPVFFKDTTDFHYPVLLTDTGFLRQVTHTFMIRHPRDAIASHYALVPDLGRDEIGFAWLHEIFSAVASATGGWPPVIDADVLIDRPEETIRWYCAQVGIPYLHGALSWRPGVQEPWRRTSRWHVEVSRSSRFQPSPGGPRVNVEEHPVLGEYYRYHLPFYEALAARCGPDGGAPPDGVTPGDAAGGG